LRATAATARTNTTPNVEIEMDATVAMFQAFEIETAPQPKARRADAPQQATEDESADSSKQAPQVQPVDRASLSPLSVLLAAAATTIRKRTAEQDEQRKSLRLRQIR
jgi:hypothetical protein